MSRRSLCLWLAVLLLSLLPLWWVPDSLPPEGDAAVERFGGADARAQQAIKALAPDYLPWFQPLMEPASGELASLVFALQAALGAGVVGYWLGVLRTRARLRRECRPDQPGTDTPDHRAD
ncbi:energy-coupling factor ABC transporter substrate-binding protein [Hydrogenophaga sp.]|uniref:energy-coupling factor ABC transporter substrate-binding protein n=1 Tax=Hydrogenophaga sp. TaxID=1904254 RepID=UPI00391CEB5E